MRELIQENAAVKAAYDAKNYPEVLRLLNNRDVKVIFKDPENKTKPGHVNFGLMGRVLKQKALGTFLLAMNTAIETNKASPSLEDKAVGYTLEAALTMFQAEEIDFTNDEIRSNISAVLTAANVPVEPYLALGYTLTSLAQQSLSRDATQADIDLALKQDVLQVDIENLLRQARNAAEEAYRDSKKTPQDILAAAKKVFSDA